MPVEERRYWYTGWRRWGVLAWEASLMLIAIMWAVFVLWLVLSRPNAKLYEADNVVCVSQPLAQDCFERKATPEVKP